MSDVKVFQVAARDALDDKDYLEFAFADEEDVVLKVFRPSPAQFGMTMARLENARTDVDKIGPVINFFLSVLSPEGAKHVEYRLMDRTDPLDVDILEDAISWISEQWAGRPTEPSSDSTQSRQDDGQNSTPRTPRLI